MPAEQDERLDEVQMRGALLVAGQASLGDHVTLKGRTLLGTAFVQLAEDNQKLRQRLGLPLTFAGGLDD